MAKRKSDEYYQAEIHHHRQKTIELLDEAKELHTSSLINGVTAEHLKTLKTVVAKQREAISEMKKATRIQQVLMKRQTKMIINQRNQIYSTK